MENNREKRRGYIEILLAILLITSIAAGCRAGKESPEEKRYGLIYEQIEQGDWGGVVKQEELSFLWEKHMEDYEWRRADLNEDGIVELIGELWKGDALKKPIGLIFSCQNGKVELVYTDHVDAQEFLFLGKGNRLVYESSTTGNGENVRYSLCKFDENWNKIYLDSIKLYRFAEDELLTAEEKEQLCYYYPTTYKLGGSGVYYVRERRSMEGESAADTRTEEWIEEIISSEEFLSLYEEMAGHDYFQVEDTYSHSWILEEDMAKEK